MVEVGWCKKVGLSGTHDKLASRAVAAVPTEHKVAVGAKQPVVMMTGVMAGHEGCPSFKNFLISTIKTKYDL